MGFAWSSFGLYRLYLLTGNEHYLQTARISAHNTKQSMNLGQKLYPGEAEGLQQEAFQVKTSSGNPRRMSSVMEALTWNFAAHLDPMMRFKDAFGTIDLEEVERMPKEEVLAMQKRYAQVQSSDYGQTISGIGSIKTDADTAIWNDGDRLYIQSDNTADIKHINLYDTTGQRMASQAVCFNGAVGNIQLPGLNAGINIIELIYGSGQTVMQKLIYNR